MLRKRRFADQFATVRSVSRRQETIKGRLNRWYAEACPTGATRRRAKLQTALELLDVAERMLRRRLHRENPGLSDEAIEERVAAWYRKRPGAEGGDGVGVVSQWPRRRTS